MGELAEGTVLTTVGGGEAIVAELTWREGDFEVFNFEVEGVHNYFVSAPGGGDGVLVHNGCGPRNAPENIGGRDYSGHALDQMEDRGFTPSIVEETIENGDRTLRPPAGSRHEGTTARHHTENNHTVVTSDETGRVVTTFKGKPRGYEDVTE